MLARSMSLTDTMEARRDAFVSLRALEAEIILLLSIPEETRTKLIAMVSGVREELVSVIETIQRSNQSNTNANNTPSLSSPRKGGSGTFPAPPSIASPKTMSRANHRFQKQDSRVRPNGAHVAVPHQPSTAATTTTTNCGSGERRATDMFMISSSPLGLEEEEGCDGGGSVDCVESAGAMEDSDQALQSTSFVDDDGMAMGSGTTSRKSIATTELPPAAAAISPRRQHEIVRGLSQKRSPLPSNPNHHNSVVANTSFSSTIVSANGPTPPSPQQLMALPQSSYGHCIAAAVYMALEYLLIGCQADRLALFTKTARGGGLELACMVGPGVAPAKRGVMVSPVGLVQAVFGTQIAANLDTATYEDVAECPGPTTAKNVLAFPVIDATSDMRAVQGVVMLVNKQHGTKPFDASDEHLLHIRLPCLSYILRQYPLEYAAFPFDPAPLHRLTPLPVWTSPTLSIPKTLSCAPHPQRVFHRNGAEKFIRRQALTLTDDIVQAPSMADSLWNVEAYIAVLEDCWKRGIADRIEVELSLRQKMQHLSDAREILVRKQKKFDILKETLCEQLEHNVVDAPHSRPRRR